MHNISQIGWYRGRMIRDGAGHPAPGAAPAAASGAGDGNNSGASGEGNSEPAASGTSDSNNTGASFDPAAFWTGPAPASDGAPSGESATGTGSESGTQGDGQRGDFATQLTERLNGLTFGDPIFNAEVAEQINGGNYDGVQERFTAMGREIVRESMALQVQILRPFAEQLIEQMRSETNQTFTNRDDTESLVTLFPAAKNPVMAKTIEPIYKQALKNAKGDRAVAVAQTKEMLRFMAGESASDLNIEIAPRGQGDRGGPTPNFNWLDELTGR
jgi:hypothetical protein